MGGSADQFDIDALLAACQATIDDESVHVNTSSLLVSVPKTPPEEPPADPLSDSMHGPKRQRTGAEVLGAKSAPTQMPLRRPAAANLPVLQQTPKIASLPAPPWRRSTVQPAAIAKPIEQSVAVSVAAAPAVQKPIEQSVAVSVAAAPAVQTPIEQSVAVSVAAAPAVQPLASVAEPLVLQPPTAQVVQPLASVAPVQPPPAAVSIAAPVSARVIAAPAIAAKSPVVVLPRTPRVVAPPAKAGCPFKAMGVVRPPPAKVPQGPKRHGPRGTNENSSWHTAMHRAKRAGPEALALFYSVWPKPKPAAKGQ